MNQHLGMSERLTALEKTNLEHQNTLTTLFVALLVTAGATILSVAIGVKLFAHADHLQKQVDELKTSVTAIIADAEKIGG